MSREALDFYIDTVWSMDNIDSFYFRTDRRLMHDRTRAVLAVEDGLGFLAHLDHDWTQPFDPYRLALAAQQLETKLPLQSIVLLTERLTELGILDGELRLQAGLRPAVERYARGFAALEQQEKYSGTLRELGMGPTVPAEDGLYPILLAACRNDHKSQYRLASLYLDGEIEREISARETCGSYWLRRAAQNGNAYARQKLERRARSRTMDWALLHTLAGEDDRM